MGITAASNPFAGDPSQASLTDGYTYSHVDLLALLPNLSQQETFVALNLMDISGTYNKGLLLPINDANENEVGGVATPPLTGDCLGLGPIACTQFVGTGEIEANSRSILLNGSSPWFFASNDPMINFIPEPNVLALTGLGLVAMAAMRRRRRV